MIAACTALGVIVLCLIAFRALAHPDQRIRWEHIEET
jgi:hypothetical protein